MSETGSLVTASSRGESVANSVSQGLTSDRIDHEIYARVDGIWMFRQKRSEPLMSVPFETGWAKTRFA
jgi:hypothetical protein